MKSNWLALYVAIVTIKTVDASLGAMGIRPKQAPKIKLDLSERDIKLLKNLKKQNTWDELGKLLGVKGESLRLKVKNYKKTTKELCKATSVDIKNNSIIV